MFIKDSRNIRHVPQRVISTVPSITELLAYLGLNKETTGITKFCVHPEEWFRTKTRIGGTKNLNIEKISSLGPDLIFCNKEENVKEQVEALAKICPVCLTDVRTFKDALNMNILIGELTGRGVQAEDLVENIRSNFSTLGPQPAIRTAYLIWKGDPYMTIGGDTFISDMMQKAGFKNIYQDQTRYPQLTLSELQTQNPELILLSSEPYPFKEKHIAELKTFLPATEILLADGEMFSWYGSRMLYAPEYFKRLRANNLFRPF